MVTMVNAKFDNRVYMLTSQLESNNTFVFKNEKKKLIEKKPKKSNDSIGLQINSYESSTDKKLQFTSRSAHLAHDVSHLLLPK